MIQRLIILLAMPETQVPPLVGDLRACKPQLERACRRLWRPQPREAHVPKLRPNAAKSKQILKKIEQFTHQFSRVSNFNPG